MEEEIRKKLKSIKRNIAIIKVEVIIFFVLLAFLGGFLVGRLIR